MNLLSEEDEICRAFAPFGKMVALGSPSDQLPRLGSQRHYASDATWRTQVRYALDRCTLVVLAAGSGGGLAWEVNELVARNNPRSLVLLVSRDRKKYESFREEVGTLFPRGLPSYQGFRFWFRIPWSRHVRAVIWFDSEWTPYWERLNLDSPLMWRGRTIRAIPRALWRFFYRAGVPFRVYSTAPRPRAVKVAVLLLCYLWSAPAVILTYLILAVIDGGGGDNAADLSVLTQIILVIYFLLFYFGVAAFIYRVWEGGHLAVTIARDTSLMLSMASVVFLYLAPMVFSLMAAIARALAASDSAEVQIPLVLLVAFWLWIPSLLGPPFVFWMLLRREVREWVDLRL